MKLKKLTSKADLPEAVPTTRNLQPATSASAEAFLIDSSEKEARKIIESLKGKSKTIALQGGDDAFNRRAIETLKINYLLSPEKNTANSTLKQRDSGLNHVTAKEAAKRDITILIDFAEIQKLKGKEKARRLEKIIQNIKICRKAKCKIKIWDSSNKTNEVSLKSFGISLGMSSQQSKDAPV